VTLAKGREVFEKNKLECQTFEYGMENTISFLTRAYGPAYAHFDKREKDATKSIFRAFIKGTSQIFSILAGNIDKTSSIPLAKFIIIPICFGINRAIFAYKDMDLMWKDLEHEWEDLHLTVQVQGSNIYLKLPHLPEIRDIFDHFFRDIRYDSFFYQKEVVVPQRSEKQEEKTFFSEPISTHTNRGCLAPPGDNTSFYKQIDPSWSEQERKFQSVLPENYTFENLEREKFSNSIFSVGFSERETKEGLNRGIYCFSDYSRELKNREEVRISGEKSSVSGLFYPDVCYMAPNLARVRDEGSQSDLRKGIYELSPSVVERQEPDLAIDSFDYCVFGETIEEILGVKFAKTVFKDPGSKERTKIGILRRVLSDPFSSRKVKMLVNDELGKVDYPKMHEQQVNSTTKAVLDLVQNTETLRQKEPPPIFGNSCNTERLWKL